MERVLFGSMHRDVRLTLTGLARLCERKGDWAGAMQARQEAATIQEQLWGKKHWQALDARWEAADQERRERMTDEQHQKLKLAAALDGRMARLHQQGRFREALEPARRALSLRKEVFGHKHPDYALSLNALAVLYHSQGEHRRALSLFGQAVRLLEEVLGKAHPAYASVLDNLAVVYRDLGEHQKAFPLYQQALRIRKEAQGEAHPDYARGLNNLALLYHVMGSCRRALPLYQQALAIRKAALGEKHPDYADSLNNLASLYQALGEQQRALTLFRRALRLTREALGERHPSYAVSLNNLALLYQSIGQHRQALPLYRQALRLREEAGGEKHPEYAAAASNLAALFMDMGEYRKALPLFQQALRLARERLGHKHPAYAKSLNNLALLDQKMGEHAQALPLYQQALELSREALGALHPDQAVRLTNLARFYQEVGRPAAAAVLVGQALAIKQRHVQDTLAVLSERQRQRHVRQNENALAFFLSVGADLVPASCLYGWVARSKGVLAARAAEERLFRDEPEVQPLLAELREVRAALARLAGQTPPPAEMEAWRQRFDETERRKEQLQATLAARSQTFALLRQPPSSHRVEQALPARTALVEFLTCQHPRQIDPRTARWQVEDRWLAFVLRKDREPVLIRFDQPDLVERALRSWRLAVISGAGDPRGEDARLLREKLWSPIEEHLGGIETVLIAPDGVLALLPFAALPGRKAGTFLLEDYTIGYLHSGRQLLEPTGKKLSSSGLLALGGPDFGPPAGKEGPIWQELPGTEVETRRVEAIFRSRFAERPIRRLSANRADRSRLLLALGPASAGSRWRFLHLATHGFLESERLGFHPAVLGGWAVGAGAAPGLPGWTTSLAGVLAASDPGMVDREHGFDPTGRSLRLVEGNPLVRTGLVLAGANRVGRAATLTAEEIAGLDLRGCELAVLSACETALGRLTYGQGVQGLPRAFHEAGVKNVLTSLWSVSDAATSVLMEHFYTQLWEKGQSPLQAMRRAQLFVLKNPWRVHKRAAELRERLVKRGVREEVLAARGIGRKAGLLPAGSSNAKRSPVAWWAPWVLSGVPGR
jgi:tetratricopeptide (TPR) repeat protein